MPQIHVTMPDGAQAAYSDEQFQTLWQQGQFPEGSSYWHDGMPVWRPVSEYAAGAAAAPAPVTAPAPAQTEAAPAPGDIHISTPDGSRATYAEGLIRKLWQENRLPETTLFWKDGMADWKPLREWLGMHAPAATGDSAASDPLPAGPGGYRFTKDLTIFTYIIEGLFALFFLRTLAAIFLEAKIVSMTATRFFDHDSLQGLIVLLGLVEVLTIGLYICCVVFFCIWVYRANVNARGFGALGMSITPGWAVGYFFIPFLHLVRPYEAMSELWRASKDPVNWKTFRAPLVGAWWTAWLLFTTTKYVASNMTKTTQDDPSAARSALKVLIAGETIGLAATVLVMLVVLTVFRSQKDLVDGKTQPAG